MSNIQYFTDGEQATAAVLNRPLKDLEKSGQYMSKAQFEINVENNREKFAGSGIIQKARVSSSNRSFFNGMHTASSIHKISGDVNTMCLNTEDWTGSTDKKRMIFNANGVIIKYQGTSVNTHGYKNIIKFPEAPTLNGVENNQMVSSKDYKKNEFIYLNSGSGTNLVSYGDFDTQEKLDQFINHTNKAGQDVIQWDDTNNRLAIINSGTVEDDVSWTEDSGNFDMIPHVTYKITYTVDLVKGNSYRIYNTHLYDTYYMTEDSSESGTFTRTFTTTSPLGLGFAAKADANGDTEVYFSNVKIEVAKPAILSVASAISSGSKIYDRNRNNLKKVDSVSRQDYVFLETWYEDISDKDIVYPFGNTQYNSNTNMPGLSGITEGTFSGADTYSLFGDWQEAGDLIGKGYIWSSLNSSQKLKLAGNKDHNIYKDGDKFIQVRYRIRVVKGLGNSWNLRLTGGGAIDSNSYRLRPKMNVVSTQDINDTITGATLYQGGRETNPNYIANKDFSWPINGIHKPGTSGYSGHNKMGVAIPIALVQRRNVGAFDPVHNPEGSSTFGDDKLWYETSDSHNNLVDCFNNKANGNVYSDKSGTPDGLYYDEINYRDVNDLRMFAHKILDNDYFLEKEFNKLMAGTVRGKETNRKSYFKAVVSDRGAATNDNYINFSFADINGNKLRVNVNNATTGGEDRKRYGIYLKMLTGEYKDIDGGNGPGVIHARYIRTYASRLHVYDFENGNGDTRLIKEGDEFEIYRVDKKWYLNDIAPVKPSFELYHNSFVQNDRKLDSVIIGDPRTLIERVKYTVIDGTSQEVDLLKNDYVLNDDGHIYRSLVARAAVDLDTDDYTSTTNWIDLGTDGTIGGYPSSWKENGIQGEPLLNDSFGKSLLPADLTGATYTGVVLPKKYYKIVKAIMYYSNGDIVNLEVGSVSGEFPNKFETGSSRNTQHYLNRLLWNTTDSRYDEHAIIQVFYEVYSNMTQYGSLSTVKSINQAVLRKGHWNNHGNILQGHLINKVSTSIDNYRYGDVMQNMQITNFTKYYGSDERMIGDTQSWPIPAEHSTPIMNSHDANGGSIKILPYLSSTGGTAKITLVYKELKYDYDLTVGGIGYSEIDGSVNQNLIKGHIYLINGGPLDGFIVQAHATGEFGLGEYHIDANNVIYNTSNNPETGLIRWNGNGWGDDNKFQFQNGQHKRLDDNGQSIQYGTQQAITRYFID